MSEKSVENINPEHVESQRQAIEDQTHHPKDWWNVRVILYSIILGLALGLYGYDNAFVSPLVSLPLFVLKYQGPGVGGVLAFTADNLDLVVTVPLVGAALGAFVSIPAQKYLGRKYTMLAAYACCCMPGSFLQLFAPNLGALVVGRVWNYIGVSMLTNVAPLFLSELLPAHVRARAVGFSVAGTGAVSVIATAVVYATSTFTTSREYQIPLAVQVVWPCLLFILTLFVTESPIWLLARGRVDEARKNLMLVRNNNVEVVEAELAVQSLALKRDEEIRKGRKWYQILQGKNLERTLMSGFPVSASQVGGQILAGTYSTVLLVQSGVSDAFEITIIVFLLTFVGQMVGPYLVDVIGRRPIAIYGFSLVLAIDIAAGGLAFSGLTTKPQAEGLAALSIIFAFVNAICFGTLSFLVPTEIPTAALREPTITWSTFWGYVTAVVTTFAVPQIISPGAGDLGAKSYLIFGGCMVINLIVAYFYLPETSKRTLAEIDELYATGLPKRQWAAYRCTITEDAAAHDLQTGDHKDVIEHKA